MDAQSQPTPSLNPSYFIFMQFLETFYQMIGLKARSHGAFFFCAFAMWKMDYVGVNEGVHTVRFQVCAIHWCV